MNNNVQTAHLISLALRSFFSASIRARSSAVARAARSWPASRAPSSLALADCSLGKLWPVLYGPIICMPFGSYLEAYDMSTAFCMPSRSFRQPRHIRLCELNLQRCNIALELRDTLPDLLKVLACVLIMRPDALREQAILMKYGSLFDTILYCGYSNSLHVCVNTDYF